MRLCTAMLHQRCMIRTTLLYLLKCLFSCMCSWMMNTSVRFTDPLKVQSKRNCTQFTLILGVQGKTILLSKKNRKCQTFRRLDQPSLDRWIKNQIMCNKGHICCNLNSANQETNDILSTKHRGGSIMAWGSRTTMNSTLYQRGLE